MFTIKEGTAPEKVGEGTAPEVIESITKFLEKGGRVIRTTEQDAEYVRSKAQQEADKAFYNHAKMVDTTIAELTGITKADEKEKTTDYAKRALAEKLKAVNDLQAQLADLKSKGADGNALAAEYKGRVSQLENQIAKLNEEKGKEINELKGRIFESTVGGHVQTAFGELRAILGVQGLDPKLMEDIIAARMLRFRSENNPVESEGMLIWKDKEGNVRLSKQNAKPLSTKEILEPYFADLIDKGKKQGGAGSGGAGGGGATETWKDLSLPSEVKSRNELYKWLRDDAKIPENSKEFNEAFANLGKNLPIERKK